MAAYELLLLNTSIPQIQAAQSGDTYLCPRELAVVVNSATDAVRITQTGTGNALLVEDAANPDATPFVVTAAGDVGIGTSSPGQKLDVVGSIRAAQTGANALVIANVNTPGTSYSSQFQLQIDGTYYGLVGAAGYAGLLTSGSAAGDMVLRTNSKKILFTTNDGATTSLTLDSSGNLGLGVTPSAWSAGKSFEIGNAGDGLSINYGEGLNLNRNAYYNGGFKYGTSDFASRYAQASGQHRWYTAPSGTAGNAISFTQAMTLDASGNLGIGNTNLSALLHVGKVAQNADVAIMIGNGATSDYTASTATLQFRQGGNGGATLNAGKIVSGRTGNYSSSADADSYLAFFTAIDNTDTERARITSGGDFQVSSGGSVQVGGTAARATTAGTNRLDIFNGTAPVGTLTNGISIYSSSGEAYVMDAAGNATLFSPHDAETNEWIFKSKHTPTGKVLKIDVERLLKFVNDHFGLDAVHEFVEE